ncbi:hypothetical protein [Micromonospora chersina]|uniref:hypothetical protein n=1 Tax=Micromonospora chersina TaxID=47854 RepID=UPI0037215027
MTRVGWCPGGRTVAEMLAMYPGTTAVRIFVGAGKPLPTWDGPVLGPIPAGVLIHVSFKTWDLPAVERWLTAMPADHAPIILTYAHEPEQGTAAGDPTVEVFRARWAELVAALADHPRRADVLLVPVYTRYWWQAHPGDVRWLVPMVDAIGWDIYNNGTTYRTPADLLSIPRGIAKRTGLPYLIAELGAVDIGPGRAEWMQAMVAAAREDGAWTVCWFHKDEWDLAATTAQATWRELTQEATVAWIKGQQWRVVRSLDRLNEQIRAAYPRAVPPATDPNSWGSLADSLHSSTSDHYPHFYAALGATAVVCARDFPHAPSCGLDAHALADRLRASRDPRIGYVISNGRITGPSHGWQWDPYSGSDPHDTHIHVSTVHTAAADDTRDWQIGEDDSMDRTEFIEHFKAAMNDPTVAALMKARPWQYPVDPKTSALNALFGQQLPQLAAAVKGLGEAFARESANPDEIRALLAELQPLDVDVIAERLKASLPASTPISDDQLKRVLRDLLGSLDEAPQSAPE